MLIKRISNFALAAGIVFFGYANIAISADAYIEASQAACNHLKDCARQNMDEVPEQYREMLEMTLNSMCQHLPSAESIPGFGSGHKFYQPAIACMKSITALSCATIDESGASTPECEKLGNMQ